MKVLEKAGFHKCGIFKKACFKNGQFVDCHCYEFVNLAYVYCGEAGNGKDG